jgi:hypothetical protein
MIVDLAKAREEHAPHMTGKALCLGCKNTWVAVAPIGTVELQCSNCELPKGRFLNLVEDKDMHWTCNCGNQFFHITQKRIYCVNCGETVEPF